MIMQRHITSYVTIAIGILISSALGAMEGSSTSNSNISIPIGNNLGVWAINLHQAAALERIKLCGQALLDMNTVENFINTVESKNNGDLEKAQASVASLHKVLTSLSKHYENKDENEKKEINRWVDNEIATVWNNAQHPNTRTFMAFNKLFGKVGLNSVNNDSDTLYKVWLPNRLRQFYTKNKTLKNQNMRSLFFHWCTTSSLPGDVYAFINKEKSEKSNFLEKKEKHHIWNKAEAVMWTLASAAALVYPPLDTRKTDVPNVSLKCMSILGLYIGLYLCQEYFYKYSLKNIKAMKKKLNELNLEELKAIDTTDDKSS